MITSHVKYILNLLVVEMRHCSKNDKTIDYELWQVSQMEISCFEYLLLGIFENLNILCSYVLCL